MLVNQGAGEPDRDFNNQEKKCLVYDNHEYRVAYVNKNGHIMWRCTTRGSCCKATLQTDPDITSVPQERDIHDHNKADELIGCEEKS